MVDQVHRLFSLARLTCTESTHGWPVRGGCSPVSYRGGAPAGSKLAASPYGGAGVRLGRGKLPRTTATASAGSRWRLELPKVLAMASSGSAVLADGEVARAAFRVARLSG